MFINPPTVRSAKTKSTIAKKTLSIIPFYRKEPSATQLLLSRAAIDAGADLVVGHHSHVVQPIEQYKNGWIAYGLGNFIFDQGFSPETLEGLVLKVEVDDQ